MAGNKTILLAEDNQDDMFLVQAALASVQVRHPLQVVGNGQEAIRYLKGEGQYADRTVYPFPFLLLLDLKLPIQDGFAVLKWLQAQPQIRRQLTVVVLTGTENDESMERARELGPDAYYSKPLSFHELEELVLELKRRWMEPGNRHV